MLSPAKTIYKTGKDGWSGEESHTIDIVIVVRQSASVLWVSQRNIFFRPALLNALRIAVAHHVGLDV